MLNLLIGAAAVVCLVTVLLRRRKRKKISFVDWLLARDIQPEKTEKRRRTRVSDDTVPQPVWRPEPEERLEEPRGAVRIRLSYLLPGDRVETAVPVTRLPFRVGSGSGCDYVIPDHTVSRDHFEIDTDRTGAVTVCNHSRTNGIVPIRADGSEDAPILEDGVVLRLRPGRTLRFWAGDVCIMIRD